MDLELFRKLSITFESPNKSNMANLAELVHRSNDYEYVTRLNHAIEFALEKLNG